MSKAKSRKEHGGSLAVSRRRIVRPLNLNQSHHITLKSRHAIGPRSLFRHKKLILNLIRKNSIRFQVKVYEYAIQGNHIHLLVKAKTRENLQNFFRVIAGHSAQKILALHPLKTNTKNERGGAFGRERVERGGAPLGNEAKGCRKNQRKFWSFLLYSRVVSWGREFKIVTCYIQKNTLELLKIIAYQARHNTYVRSTS